MNVLIHLLNASLPVFYITVTYLYGIYFFRMHPFAKSNMGRLLNVTLGIHLLEILLRSISLQYFPITNVFEAITLLALAITSIYRYIESRIKVKATGFFVLIVVSVLQLVASLFISFRTPFSEIFNNPMFIFHTSTAILGYAALFISALYGLMYLLLFYNLKSAQFGVIYRRMPSLEELNEMNVSSAIVGFLFLSIAIFMGLLLRKNAFPDAEHFDPKVIVSYLAWVIYGMIIYGRKIGKWSGKHLSYLSLSGFVIIVSSLVAFNLFVSTFHRFG